MKDQYVLLTGSKNNAGDYLIKYRAKQLFKELKPEVNLVDIDAWEELSENSLKIINESKALILLGGPAVQNKMYPRVYRLTPNLDDIKVPILAMGVGWYSKQGDWKNTHDYNLDAKSIELLTRINDAPYYSSVRDYHTKNVLNTLGLTNFRMTGCPALYDINYLGKEVKVPANIKKVGFSLGAAILSSKGMLKQMKELFLETKKLFPEAEVETVFHHSPSDKYLNAPGANKQFHNAQLKFLNWLESNSFNWVDISGSAENLMNYYNTVDLHVGYRVHAHIYMSSMSKPTVLVSEDGRGKALEKVIGGVILESVDKVNSSLLLKALRKLDIIIDDTAPLWDLKNDFRNIVGYELNNGVKIKQTRIEIDRHFSIMKEFIAQLP